MGIARFKSLLRNPITVYLQSAYNAVVNSRKYHDYAQGYLAHVTECEIEPHVRVDAGVRIGKSKIGSYSYVSKDTRISGGTQIGRFCSIGPGCRIALGKHPTQFVSTSPVFFSTGRQCGTTFVDSDSYEEYSRVVIGNDVWIGANVLVAGGVKIGNGAIVAGGAVVVSDIPDYAIYGGVPARLIRYRFEKAEIEILNRFAWWNKDEQWLRAHVGLFQDVPKFLALAGDALTTTHE